MQLQAMMEVLDTDECIGMLLAKLKEIKLVDKTIIVVASDHGERLYEPIVIIDPINNISSISHKFGHGGIWKQVLHIPLIIKSPTLSPTKIDKDVQLIDVMPTILDILNIPAPENIQGKTLVPIIEGKEESKPVYSEHYPLISIKRGDIRIKYNRELSLLVYYNLTNDPGELMPIIPNETLKNTFEKRILEWILSNEELSKKLNIKESNVTLEEEIEMRLRQLGYIK